MPWINDGGYRILQQSHVQSCGPCCVGMVVQLLTGNEIPEATLCAQCGVTGYHRAAQDRIGAVATPLVSVMRAGIAPTRQVEFWGTGTFANTLAEVLRRHYRIDATVLNGVDHNTTKAAMRASADNRPMIVMVQWHAGGAHWVVVLGRRSQPFVHHYYTILDPVGKMNRNPNAQTYGHGDFAGYGVTTATALLAAPPPVAVM